MIDGQRKAGEKSKLPIFLDKNVMLKQIQIAFHTG